MDTKPRLEPMSNPLTPEALSIAKAQVPNATRLCVSPDLVDTAKGLTRVEFAFIGASKIQFGLAVEVDQELAAGDWYLGVV